MQKIILTLLFSSVVIMANNDNNATKILTKTLKGVKSFKKEKNEEIQMLKLEILLLKDKLHISKIKQHKEIKKLNALKVKQEKKIKKLHYVKVKQQSEIKKVKQKLVATQHKVLKHKTVEAKLKKKLKTNAAIIKDLHFLLKQKGKVEMDEYALGKYYFNL